MTSSPPEEGLPHAATTRRTTAIRTGRYYLRFFGAVAVFFLVTAFFVVARFFVFLTAGSAPEIASTCIPATAGAAPASMAATAAASGAATAVTAASVTDVPTAGVAAGVVGLSVGLSNAEVVLWG